MVQNHFTATGIVFNPTGKILMMKHKKLGVWLPPGGHIDDNELPCDACLREIFEETGVNAKIVSANTPIGTGDDCKELAQPLVILLEDIAIPVSHDTDGAETTNASTAFFATGSVDVKRNCDIEQNWRHNHIDLVYMCRAESDSIVQNDESDEVGWFSPEEVQLLDTFENVRRVVAKAALRMAAI